MTVSNPLAPGEAAQPIVVAAVDLGATSGRVMLGRVAAGSADSGGTLDLEEIARFPNEPVQREDGLHWDIATLREAVLDGLADAHAAAEREGERIASIGIDSWAVDYGTLRGGELIGEPFHYRDARNDRGVELVHAVVPFEELYERNGLQFLPFNTLYQLAADEAIAGASAETSANGVDGIALIPDLFGYWLTGERVAEETNASTTGLVPAATATPEWDAELAARTGLPAGILPRIVRPGSTIGTLTPEVAKRTGLPRATAVVAVGSHDTASAVVATPLETAGSVFVSCGTWGLVGVETPAPVPTVAARDSGFTNERGVDGTTRLLHNVMGLWVLNECVRAWRSDDGATDGLDLTALLDAASRPGVRFTVFDIDDPRLMPPGDMPARVAQLCQEAGGGVPAGRAEYVRSIVESLADAFARAAAQASALAGVPLAAINVVGGGALNALLCQTTADRAGVPVIAGPVEATALGNVLVQARAAGAITGALADLRALVAATQRTTRFQPR
jgi:rhamnulokinase